MPKLTLLVTNNVIDTYILTTHVNWPLNIFFNEAAGHMQKFGQITRKEGVSEERLKRRKRDRKNFLSGENLFT